MAKRLYRILQENNGHLSHFLFHLVKIKGCVDSYNPAAIFHLGPYLAMLGSYVSAVLRDHCWQHLEYYYYKVIKPLSYMKREEREGEREREQASIMYIN